MLDEGRVDFRPGVLEGGEAVGGNRDFASFVLVDSDLVSYKHHCSAKRLSDKTIPSALRGRIAGDPRRQCASP